MIFLKKIIVAIITLESKLILRKYKPFIVAVTGSVGKTSAKDAIFSVLTSSKVCSEHQICYVRKSEKSLNSEIGLPLSIIGAPNAWKDIFGWIKNIWLGFGLIIFRKDYPDCLVLEVGADHPGDIKKVTSWLHPDIAVIARISQTPVHVEFFNSPEEVFEEKQALALAIKEGGTLVIYADDSKTLSIKNNLKQKNISVITFGTSSESQIRGIDSMVDYEDVNGVKTPIGFSFNLDMRSRVLPIKVKKALGKPYIYTLLSAAAVGQAKGVSEDDIGKALNDYKVTNGRMVIIEGLNNSTLIDDTYNSSPDAAISALETVKDLQSSGSKIAVLGDMMELGQYAGEQHRIVGKSAAESVNRLVTVGQRSRLTAEEAEKNGLAKDMVNSFDTAEEAATYLAPLIVPGDIILIKGSQSVRMEKVTKALLREPNRAGELLVRQEKEWLEKK